MRLGLHSLVPRLPCAEWVQKCGLEIVPRLLGGGAWVRG